MAILQRIALYPSERFDLPDARALQAHSANDWRYFIQGMFSEKSYIFNGFEITNHSSIFISNTAVKIKISDASFIHPESTTQAVGFYVASGSEADLEINLPSDGTSYIEADLNAIGGSLDTRAFWDVAANGGAGGEYTDEVNTVINLEVKITSNISGFTDGKIPLYKITTTSGVATKVEDCRKLFYSLVEGGSGPDLENRYGWSSYPDADHAQLATPSSVTNASQPKPFQGGDKNIKTLKNWMDAMMTALVQHKGSTYWYQQALSVPQVYQNSSLSVLIGGTWKHESGIAGTLSLTGNSTLYRMGQSNNCTLSQFILPVDLATNRILFVILPDDEAVSFGMGQDGDAPVSPKKVSNVTYNTIQVTDGGNYVTTGGNIRVKNVVYSYSAYSEAGGYGTFSDVSPDPTSIVDALNQDYVYQEADGGTGYYHYGASAAVPGIANGSSEGAERVYWLAIFDGTSKIIMRNGDLEVGEEIQVGDNTSLALISYIGSTGEADSSPVYNVNTIPNGTNLTEAIATAFEVIETPIYDEVIIDSAGAGLASGSTVILPTNTKTSTAAFYTVGTSELKVFENGLLLRPRLSTDASTGGDYIEVGTAGNVSNSIQLQKPMAAGSTLRFVVDGVGGAGTTSGIIPVVSVSNPINNGMFTGTTSFPGNTTIINNGYVGILNSTPTDPLHIKNSQTSPLYMNIENPAGSGTTTLAGAKYTTYNGTASTTGLYVGHTANTYTYDAIGANTSFVDGVGVGGLALAANNAAGELKFYTGGLNKRMVIDSAGRVGIGVAAPTAYLDVRSGGFGVGETSGNTGRFNFYSASYSVPTATYVPINLRDGDPSLSVGENYRIRLFTAATSATTGAVYIINQSGSSTWTAKLVSAQDTASNNPQLRVNGTAVEVYHNHASTYSITAMVEGYTNANSTVVHPAFFGLDASMTYLLGNLGVGTESPSYKLDVNGNIIAVGTKTGSSGYGGNIRFRDDTGTMRWLSGLLGTPGAVNYSIYDVVNSTTRLMIDTSGNVGIGTTPSQKLSVAGTVESTTGGFKFPNGTIQTIAANTYDAIVGSGSQATHSTITAALAAISTDGKIFIMPGTYSETLSINKRCSIEGAGYGTNLTGAVTMSVDYTTLRSVRFATSLTLTCNGSFVRDCFAASAATITDSGTANSKLIIVE
jgi:hypothetical protein